MADGVVGRTATGADVSAGTASAVADIAGATVGGVMAAVTGSAALADKKQPGIIRAQSRQNTFLQEKKGMIFL
ncbi:hypothetical protein [Rahnella sp. AA]|uniref:hypothetical protein n=1 Tax=Rahnella sp. AA TaxID=2057180 RepID=UPI0018E3B08C|nr:hypothetical protein [Rahnella sp. AA]